MYGNEGELEDKARIRMKISNKEGDSEDDDIE